MSTGTDAAYTIYTDAAGSRGWGASLGVPYIQEMWPKRAFREAINWEELGVLEEALSHYRSHVKRKLMFVRLGDASAVAYASYGARRSGQLTRLPREIKQT